MTNDSNSGAPPLVCDPEKITPEWLTAALRSAGVAREAKVSSARRERVGTGQMARNFRFFLEWEGAVDDAPRSVVAKVPSDDPTSRSTGVLQGAYRKEVEFYRQIVSTVDIRTPHCWLAAIDEAGADFILLLEDVTPAEQGNQLAGCSLDQAGLALEELAKLHAPRWGDPALAELGFLADPIDERARILASIYESVWPGFRDRYASRLDSELLDVTERLGPHLERWLLGTSGALTVTHGDYRLDNMLFGTGPEAPPLAVVDWQTTSRGLGTADAAYFLGAGLALEARRAHERDLLRAYWQALRARGVSGYSWDDCWKDYRYSTFGGVVMAVIASMIVEQTPRGDDMFMAMASRHGRHVLDLEAEALLP